MSQTERHNRWLAWEPTERILAALAESEPTKPSEPGFVGFEGPRSGLSAKIEPHHCFADQDLDQKNRIEPAVDSAFPEERVMSWCEWKAAALNKLFLEQGVIGKAGRITADTIRRGEQKQAKDE